MVDFTKPQPLQFGSAVLTAILYKYTPDATGTEGAPVSVTVGNGAGEAKNMGSGFYLLPAILTSADVGTIVLYGSETPTDVIRDRADVPLATAAAQTTLQSTVAALPSSAAIAILDRVLSGNHDTVGSVGKLLQNVDVASSTLATSSALAAIPGSTLTTIKADAEWKTMLANVNGVFTYDPETGVLVLKNKAGNTTLATLTLTRNDEGEVTERASA
jgi:hypothetical protein